MEKPFFIFGAGRRAIAAEATLLAGLAAVVGGGGGYKTGPLLAMNGGVNQPAGWTGKEMTKELVMVESGWKGGSEWW